MPHAEPANVPRGCSDVKIRRVSHNNRKKAFEISVGAQVLPLPYAKLDLQPTSRDRVTRVFMDRRGGREAFRYVLASGRQGTIEIDRVLDYNDDPRALRDRLLHKLTLEAQKRMKTTPLSVREIARRLATSPSQLYRLLDATNDGKSVDQLLSLMQILDCQVDLVVR